MQENEAGKLFDVTNDIIRRITQYAAQLSEKNALGANRKEEYRKVAELFLRCQDVEEAHKMSAMVFGMEYPQHLGGDLIRETDSIYVYEWTAKTGGSDGTGAICKVWNKRVLCGRSRSGRNTDRTEIIAVLQRKISVLVYGNGRLREV